MIAVDSNILVYAHRADSPFHAAASEVIGGLAQGDDAWAIPWACVTEFVAISTNPKVYRPASTPQEAIAQLDEWMRSPTLELLTEGDGFVGPFRSAVEDSPAVGGAVYDARIAALCLYHGVSELWTADRDFDRFPRLRTRNPLVA